jgi:hypothetical protein
MLDEEFEDDDFIEPAGRFRVILGLTVMIFGVVIAAFSENAYGDGLGLIFILISPFIMVTSKSKTEILESGIR